MTENSQLDIDVYDGVVNATDEIIPPPPGASQETVVTQEDVNNILNDEPGDVVQLEAQNKYIEFEATVLPKEEIDKLFPTESEDDSVSKENTTDDTSMEPSQDMTPGADEPLEDQIDKDVEITDDSADNSVAPFDDYATSFTWANRIYDGFKHYMDKRHVKTTVVPDYVDYVHDHPTVSAVLFRIHKTMVMVFLPKVSTILDMDADAYTAFSDVTRSNAYNPKYPIIRKQTEETTHILRQQASNDGIDLQEVHEIWAPVMENTPKELLDVVYLHIWRSLASIMKWSLDVNFNRHGDTTYHADTTKLMVELSRNTGTWVVGNVAEFEYQGDSPVFKRFTPQYMTQDTRDIIYAAVTDAIKFMFDRRKIFCDAEDGSDTAHPIEVIHLADEYRNKGFIVTCPTLKRAMVSLYVDTAIDFTSKTVDQEIALAIPDVEYILRSADKTLGYSANGYMVWCPEWDNGAACVTDMWLGISGVLTQGDDDEDAPTDSAPAPVASTDDDDIPLFDDDAPAPIVEPEQPIQEQPVPAPETPKAPAQPTATFGSQIDISSKFGTRKIRQRVRGFSNKTIGKYMDSLLQGIAATSNSADIHAELRFRANILRKRIHAGMWDEGGSFMNQGFCCLITDREGEPLVPLMCRYDPELTNGTHALITLSEGYHIILGVRHESDMVLLVYRINGIASFEANSSQDTTEVDARLVGLYYDKRFTAYMPYYDDATNNKPCSLTDQKANPEYAWINLDHKAIKAAINRLHAVDAYAPAYTKAFTERSVRKSDIDAIKRCCKEVSPEVRDNTTPISDFINSVRAIHNHSRRTAIITVLSMTPDGVQCRHYGVKIDIQSKAITDVPMVYLQGILPTTGTFTYLDSPDNHIPMQEIYETVANHGTYITASNCTSFVNNDPSV